jgi:diguanylate cyclase (GGDEF)-like protein
VNIMPLRGLIASTRFFIALGVLLAALAAMAVVGLSGLAAVDGANRQVFSDNYLSAEATSRVATDLSGVEVLGLQITQTTSRSAAERLRARLDEIAIPTAGASISALVRLHKRDPPVELAQISRISARWRTFLPLTRRAPLVSGSGPATASARSAEARAISARLDPLIASVSRRQSIETDAAAAANASAHHTFQDSRAWLILAAAIAALAATTMIRIGVTLRQLLRSQAEQQQHSQSSSEYTDSLQGTESEGEAQELLCRQIQRTQAGARVVVLGRNNSADRLEARTSLTQLDELREPLEQAAPRSCLAIRFARSHTEGLSLAPLTSCELCGRVSGVSTCDPLLVGGEVIGSVLVAHSEAPDRHASQRILEAVSQAAPVLGNLRNLAIAEMRAATDRLTGLPNQRAAQDTLKRMVAQASRTITPLTAVLIDLDHFKRINDLHGHERGDEVLAAVGVAMRNAVRDSDFIGRYGGEEFLLLLPDTETEGALQVAEAVRVAIAAIRVANIEEPITVSAGTATLPRDAGDSVTLFRAADRALYAAKNNGRNRIHAATDDDPAHEQSGDVPRTRSSP